VTLDGITFDSQQVQAGSKRAIPWCVLENVEIAGAQSIGTQHFFHFVPNKGTGSNRFHKYVPSNQIESFLAETDSWRQLGTSHEALEAARQAEAEPSGWPLRWLLIALGILVTLFVLFLATIVLAR
jgi:hypothetical protein